MKGQWGRFCPAPFRKFMNLGKGPRALYGAHMKEIWDRNARDEHMY